MPLRIKNVMFDLGVVLVHLDYGPAIRRCLPLCDPDRIGHSEQFLSLLGRTPLVDAYERGEMSAREFFQHFVEQTGFRGDFDTFADIWRDIFQENTPMVDLGQELARTYPVYFMSNASDLHVPWVFDRFPRLRFHKDCAVSWELRAGKPDPTFYERALARFGVAAQESLFIDDRPENVESALQMGFQAILYQSADQAIRDARSLLAAR